MSRATHWLDFWIPRQVLIITALSLQSMTGQILTDIRNAAASSITSEVAPGSLVRVGLAPASGVIFTVDPNTAAVEFLAGDSAEPLSAQVLGASGPGVLALLPKDLPLGTAQVTLIVSGRRQLPVTVTIVPSRFALFTASDGFGPALAQNVDPSGEMRTNGLTQPAIPGQSVVLRGAGLGIADEVTVLLGGHAIAPVYAGPEPNLPGVDKIEFSAPDDPAIPDSCYVSLAVRAGGKTSPAAMLSTTRGPGSCRSPLGFTAEQMADIDAGKPMFYGSAVLFSSVEPPDVLNQQPGRVTRREGITVQFLQFDRVNLAMLAEPALADDIYFSCTEMALGSTARSVLWMVVREALLLVAVGGIAGIAISVAAWRLLSHYVPGVSAIDSPILLVCATIMLLLAAAAVSAAAIRACRIDPLTALRHE